MALYAAGGAVAFWDLWSHLATVQPESGTGDLARYDWFVAWLPWALGHGANPLVTHMANVPFGVNIADETSILALGLLAAPVTVLFGPAVSVNLLLGLAFPLSAGAGYLLARRWVTWRPAAFAAGLLYGFSPYVVAQGFSHLNLSMIPLPPLILLCLDELLRTQRGSAVRWGLGLGALVVAQFFVSTEILATTALFCLIVAAVAAVVWRRSIPGRWRHAATGLAVAAGLGVLVLAWPLYEAFAGPVHISGTIPGYRFYYSALVAPFFPTSLLALGTHHMKAIGDKIGGNVTENGTYLGVPLVVLIVATLVVMRRRAVAVMAVAMTAIAFVLSLGDHLHVGLARYATTANSVPLPGDVIVHIPKLNDAFPIRYSLFVALFASIVLGVALEALAPRSRPLAAGVGVIALLPLLPAWPYPVAGRTHVPGYFTSDAVDRVPDGSVALVYPVPINTNAAPMLWQAEAGLRFGMIGGYFVVPAPGGSQYYSPSAVQAALTALAGGTPQPRTDAARATLTAQLRAWKVQEMLVQPVGADPEGFFTWLTGRGPDARDGGLLEWYSTTWP